MMKMVAGSRGRVLLVCPQCGKEFETYLSVAKRPGTHCCSWSCEIKLHPRKPKLRVQKTCAHCGDTFEVIRKREITAKFCSRSCANAHQKGAAHWNYKDGSAHERGQSRKVINARVKEEGRCQRCGTTANLHGHHIKPHATHPDLRCDPTNIEVLCANCHALEHPALANMLTVPRIRSGRMHACETCGGEFYVKPSHEKNARRFCSVACGTGVPRRVLTQIEKSCAGCGVTYTAQKSHSSYCSRDCRNRHRRQR
jgi:5-methylcytosine-specific restriction endonuclease McrA